MRRLWLLPLLRWRLGVEGGGWGLADGFLCLPACLPVGPTPPPPPCRAVSLGSCKDAAKAAGWALDQASGRLSARGSVLVKQVGEEEEEVEEGLAAAQTGPPGRLGRTATPSLMAAGGAGRSCLPV